MRGKLRGKLIVFEGVEGSGKTTQIQQVLQWLTHSDWNRRLFPQTEMGSESKVGFNPSVQTDSRSQSKIIVTREPGGTQLGKHLRQLLLDPALSEAEAIAETAELLMYAADRAQHVSQLVQPNLAAGRIVLCDRFTDSTVAYQGYGRELDLSLIDQLNQIATGGLTSDLTLWFDVDVMRGLARARSRKPEHAAGEDRMEANDLEFHQRVQAGFKHLAQSNPQRIIRIDSNVSIDKVTQQVQRVLQQRFEQWF